DPLLHNVLGEETANALLEKIPIFEYTEDEFVAIIIKILDGLDSSAYKGEVNPFGEGSKTLNQIVNMIVGTGANDIKASDILYPLNTSTEDANDRYGSSDVAKFINVLSNIAESVLSNYLDFDLSELSRTGIYESGPAASVAKLIYPLFDSLGSVLEMIGVTVYDVDGLAQLLTENGYGSVANLVLYDITLHPDTYPGLATDTESVNPNWVYTEKIGPDGQVVTKNVLDENNKPVKNEDGTNKTEPVYEMANRFWAKYEDGENKGAYIMENGKHVMTYWEKTYDEEDNTKWEWTLDKTGNHVVREKKLSDINWDYCKQNKLFKIYVEGEVKNNRERLSDALATVLTPFIPFVEFLLNSGSLDLAGIVPLVGSAGYANAVYPLLKLLNCEGIVAPATYQNATGKALISNIIDPLLLKVDEILNGKEAIGTVRAVLDMVPDFANFIDNGGIQKLIYTLLYPIGNFVDGILTVLLKEDTLIYDVALEIVFNSGIIGAEDNDNVLSKVLGSIFGKKDENAFRFATLHEHVAELAQRVVAFLKLENIEIKALTSGSSIFGSSDEVGIGVTIKDITINEKKLDLNLIIPSTNLKWVAGIGPGRRADIATNGPLAVKKRTDSFMVIMQYIWKIVQLNKDALIDLKDGVLPVLLQDAYKTAGPFIESVLDIDIKGVTKDNFNDYKNKDNKTIIDSANEIVAALVQFTDNTDSSNHYADTKSHTEANADISDVVWDEFFKYENYTEGDKHKISYPIIPEKVAGDAYAESNKYTEADVQKTITALTVVVQEALSNLLDTKVENLVAGALYTNDIVSAVSKIIFSLADNKTVVTVLEMLGTDFSAETLCDTLEAYGYVDLAREIKTALTDKDGELTGKLSDLQWADVYEYWVTDKDGKIQYKDGNPIIATDKDEYKVIGTTPDGDRIVAQAGLSNYWYVDSLVEKDPDNSALFKEKVWDNKNKPSKVTENDLNASYRFTRALMVTLSPFSSLINILFNAGTGEFFKGAISITGTHGYRNALKPLLDVLDCNAV
ncbi:MAG: hypothetical protein K2F65_00710, partial [Eubacterium sp.]|nr:hypothetical protein [Eubacterium sp.]